MGKEGHIPGYLVKAGQRSTEVRQAKRLQQMRQVFGADPAGEYQRLRTEEGLLKSEIAAAKGIAYTTLCQWVRFWTQAPAVEVPTAPQVAQSRNLRSEAAVDKLRVLRERRINDIFGEAAKDDLTRLVDTHSDAQIALIYSTPERTVTSYMVENARRHLGIKSPTNKTNGGTLVTREKPPQPKKTSQTPKSIHPESKEPTDESGMLPGETLKDYYLRTLEESKKRLERERKVLTPQQIRQAKNARAAQERKTEQELDEILRFRSGR